MSNPSPNKEETLTVPYGCQAVLRKTHHGGFEVGLREGFDNNPYWHWRPVEARTWPSARKRAKAELDQLVLGLRSRLLERVEVLNCHVQACTRFVQGLPPDST